MSPSFRLKKQHFIYSFCAVVIILAIVKCLFPSITDRIFRMTNDESAQSNAFTKPDTVMLQRVRNDSILLSPLQSPVFFKPDGTPVKNKVFSVSSFERCFSDLNDVQLATAERLGVRSVANREGAEKMKKELVYIGSSPYFTVQKLHHSIPYLVPHASMLLNRIARIFMDSLQIKGIPLHTLIVTSVLRTEDDIQKLRNFNQNASSQSCHRYGTTFDISYNRYHLVDDPEAPNSRSEEVRWDPQLKWVLSEVLNEQRKAGMCYVKYEIHQGCYHITAR